MEVLLVSPFSPVLVIISKAVPYFFLSLLNLTIILVLSVFLLDMPFEGSVLLLFAESALLILASLSLGLLISNSTDSQQTAMLISVSYTHLDVYKRQGEGGVDLLSYWLIAVG